MNQALSQLAEQLDSDRETLDRELAEIELLLRQTRSEAERHEGRRVQAEERLVALEGNASAPAESVVEARGQLLSQTRRATLMLAQIEILEGKQRALQRYHTRLAESLPVLRGATLAPDPPESGGGAAPPQPATDQSRALQPIRQPSSHEVLAAQEQMRREIARQMHDGPAQSIANIALQAQIVQRLFERNPQGAQAELDELVKMVGEALQATKDFIFDVRPMVLDDLGLVPTLRRATSERSRRAGVPVRFESAGSDRRLDGGIESALFRIVDDALAAYAAAGTPEIVVSLDWSESGVSAVVRGRPAAQDAEDRRATAAVAAARRDKQVPQALASMIREQEREDAERDAGMSKETWADIQQRAWSVGIGVKLSSDRWLLEAALVRD